MTPASANSDVRLVSLLCQKIYDALDPLVSHASPCALLDFPSYANVGDSAIWLGEIAYLRSVSARLVYECDIAGYSQEQLASSLRGGTILLSGGGSFGDLWPRHQLFREDVIRAFPQNRIIQLPQSIHFREKENLRRAQAAINGHPDLTILVRDERSLEYVRNEFRANSALCPDMAFALGPLERPVPPSCDVLWLSRKDREASIRSNGTQPADVDQVDWLADDRSALVRLVDVVSRHMGRHPRVFRPERSYKWFFRVYEALARQRLWRGCRLLASAKTVITDRLHGHILSLLIGVPHVLLTDNFGKLRSFHDTWTRDSELALWADTLSEALKQARAMASTSIWGPRETPTAG